MFDYLKLTLYRRFQERFKDHKTNLAGYTVFYTDPKSLYSQFKDIFREQSYYFKSQKERPIIIDGGGNIGLSALYFKKIYPQSNITIFEPDPKIFLILKTNIQSNDLENINILNFGLYSSDGKVNFAPDHTDGGKIQNNGSSEIQVKKLSSYINTEVDLLKLDIEGSESTVLEELDSSEKFRHIREIILEWHSFSRTKQDLGKMLSILEKNNYKYILNRSDHGPSFRLKERTKFYIIVHAKRYDLLD